MRILAPLALLAMLSACTDTTDSVGRPAPAGAEVPSATDVDAIIYLVGDAGKAEEGKSPLMVHLRQDVEAWSGALPDSSVMVVFLGDNVYEDGVHATDHPEYATDTLRLNTQVRSVTGRQASERGARAAFLPGNHDWANDVSPEGLAYVLNQKAHLERIGAGDTADVALVPEPGTLGPAVLDVGGRARVIAVDSHWWLQSDSDAEKSDAIAAVTEALASAGARQVVIASHLPLATGGPHGGAISFFPTVGLRYLAHRSGILVQDVTARPYRAFIESFHQVFESAGPPVAMASGHDHSLQVLSVPLGETGTFTQLVSGAGSRLTDISPVEEMVWGRMAPGYMRLTFLHDGSVLLHVLQGSPTFLSCDALHERDECMAAGLDSIQVAYARRLR